MGEAHSRAGNKRRKDKQREKERDVPIPPVKDEPRRRHCESDIYAFLQTYFPEKFDTPFTDDRRAMVESILHCARYGGDQAIAGPRGEGKTTIAECVTVYCLLTGILRFPLIVASTGPDAERILANMKFEFEVNDLLAEDFPEVCAPIRALDGAAQRAKMQTVAGKRTLMVWAGSYVVFPTVPGSKASGSVLMTRGLDAAIRGIRYRNLRPDMVLIDDPETRESAKSPTQMETREQTIEQDIAGLGGPGKRIGRLVLCTIMNHTCLSAKYTDPAEKPSWRGRRYCLLESKPSREDMWEKYIDKRHEGMADRENPDPNARRAHQFYLDNREAMDAGARLSNPHRYIRDELPDGSQLEVSALQHCYNIIADRGWDNFATEYQNDPPEEAGPQDSGITALLVRSKYNGRRKGFVPADAMALTCGIDIGKWACHYTVTAWKQQAVGCVIDYGVLEVHNPNERGEEKAVMAALQEFRDRLAGDPYVTDDGEQRVIDVALIDSGYLDTVVFEFCRVAGKPFRAAKGFGSGPRTSPFRQPQHNAKTVYAGEHWYAKQTDQGWLHGLDADYWKRWTHDRFMVPAGETGCLTLFGDEAKQHRAYSQHIVAEIEKEEFVPGKGVKRYWDKVNANNHWFDATYMACAAGCMAGVRLLPQTKPQPVATASRRSGDDEGGSWATAYKGRW